VGDGTEVIGGDEGRGGGEGRQAIRRCSLSHEKLTSQLTTTIQNYSHHLQQLFILVTIT
jgi:hypothetical protein